MQGSPLVSAGPSARELHPPDTPARQCQPERKFALVEGAAKRRRSGTSPYPDIQAPLSPSGPCSIDNPSASDPFPIDNPSASLRTGRSAPCSLVWFRGHDLRVEDHPALLAASQCTPDGGVIAAYIYAEDPDLPEPAGSQVTAWWLSESLPKLKRDLEKLGVPLVLRRVRSDHARDTARTPQARRRDRHSAVVDELCAVREQAGVIAVFWNRVYDHQVLKWDEELRSDLTARGITAESFKAELLVEPWELKDDESATTTQFHSEDIKSNHPSVVFKNFFSYMKGWMALPPPPPPIDPPLIGELKNTQLCEELTTLTFNELASLMPEQRANRLAEEWSPGSLGAKTVLDEFLQDSFSSFGEARCRRDINGTSGLSPYLRFGELSPRRVYHAVRGKVATWEHWNVDKRESISQSAKAFLKNICLRDYSYHAYYYNPTARERPLLNAFEHFPWQNNPDAFEKWRTGKTGYPIVDASMRQLRATGWIHNTLRFVVASFLTKYLLLPFALGVQEFQKLLVDCDWASNSLGWQWAAGCSEDGFPFRCLVNPIGMGRRQDPTGYYIRQWVPELAKLPNNDIHCPWKSPGSTLAEAGVVLGDNYPHPIVESAFARSRAREAMQSMRPSFTKSTCASNATVVPRDVTDLIEEWPEEEPDETSTIGEQSSATKLGLLPALWRLLHYDQPPNIASVNFPAQQPSKETAISNSGLPGAPRPQKTFRTASVATPTGGSIPIGPCAGFQMVSAPGMGSMTQNPGVQVARGGVLPPSIQPSTFYVPMVAATPQSALGPTPQPDLGPVPAQRCFGQEGPQLPGPGSSPFYGMVSVRPSGEPGDTTDPYGPPRFFTPNAQASVMAHDLAPGHGLQSTTSGLPLIPPYGVHGIPQGPNSSALTPPPPILQQVSGSGAPGRGGEKRKKDVPPIADAKRPATVVSIEKVSGSPTVGKPRATRRPTAAPRSHPDGPSPTGPTSLEARKEILQRVSNSKENEYFAFVCYLLRTFSLTENTDRASSPDFVRLCKLKEDFQKVCSDAKDKMQIYKIKAFFKDVLNLEVTGEWDRRGHGGVRGPYVYGLRPYRPELFGPKPKASKR